MIERDADGNPTRLHLSAGAKRVPSNAAESLLATVIGHTIFWDEARARGDLKRMRALTPDGERAALAAIDDALDEAKVRGYEIGLMDGSLDCVDGTQIIERQGPRGRVEPTSGDGRERSQ